MTELAIAPEHHGLNETQNTIMQFEMVRALAYERIEHSAELSPRLAQMMDNGLTIGADEYDQALARTAEARAGLDGFFGRCDAVWCRRRQVKRRRDWGAPATRSLIGCGRCSECLA